MTIAFHTNDLYASDVTRYANPNQLSATEAARVLGVRTHRVYILTKQGTLTRYVRAGYTYGYYRRDEVEALRKEWDAIGDQPRH